MSLFYWIFLHELSLLLKRPSLTLSSCIVPAAVWKRMIDFGLLRSAFFGFVFCLFELGIPTGVHSREVVAVLCSEVVQIVGLVFFWVLVLLIHVVEPRVLRWGRRAHYLPMFHNNQMWSFVLLAPCSLQPLPHEPDVNHVWLPFYSLRVPNN